MEKLFELITKASKYNVYTVIRSVSKHLGGFVASSRLIYTIQIDL